MSKFKEMFAEFFSSADGDEDNQTADSVEVFAYFKTAKKSGKTNANEAGESSNKTFASMFENLKENIGEEKASALVSVFQKFDAGLAAVDPQFAGLAAAIAEPMLGKKNVQETASTETKQTQAVKPDKKSEK